MTKQDNNEVLNMIAISEEINSLNLKVQQLMRDLNGAGGVLGSIKELSDRLKDKVEDFNGSINNYQPPIFESEDGVQASYITEGIKRERITPTPSDKQYVVEEMVTPIVEVVEEKVVEDIPEEKPKKVAKQPKKKVVKEKARKRNVSKDRVKKRSLFGGGSKGIDKFSNKGGK